MNDKYEEVYNTIIFKIACLMFDEPILEIHIRLVDGWARQYYLYEQIMSLSEKEILPQVTRVECIDKNID